MADEEQQRPPDTSGQCPRCGKTYGIPYLYHHLRRQHGVFGGATGIKRRLPPPPKKKVSEVRKVATLPPLPPTPASRALAVLTTNGAGVPDVPGAGLRFTVMPFVVLEDQDGGTWLAERIR